MLRLYIECLCIFFLLHCILYCVHGARLPGCVVSMFSRVLFAARRVGDVTMVQKLSNKIVDLEKDKEVSSLKNNLNLISRKEKKVEHLNHLCISLLL